MMRENSEEICRFCFKKINDDYFGKIDQVMREILNVVCVKINLDISEDPIMCTDCADYLFKTYNFKSACIRTEDNLLSFINFDPDTKINIEEVYLSINGPKNIQGKSICRFCMNLAPSECSTLLSKLIEDMIVMKNLLEEYFPEMVSYSVKEPTICEVCLRSLHDYLDFVTKCINVEGKIQRYTKSEGVDGVGKIDLSNVEGFLEKSQLKTEVDVMDIKEAEQECYKFVENVGDMETYQDNADRTEGNNLHLTIKNEIDLKMDEDDFESFEDMPFMSEDAIKLESEDFLKISDTTPTDTTSATYRCHRCTFRTVYGELYDKHMIIHEDHSYAMRRSEIATSRTRFKYNESFHLNWRLHKKLPKRSSLIGSKCEDDDCSYKTRYGSDLKKHKQLIHNTSSQVAACRHKSDLHKRTNCFRAIMQNDPLELTENDNEHENCSYETVNQSNLKYPSETTVHKCVDKNCSHKTARKHSLKIRMLGHKSSSEITMDKCENENCSFKTLRKNGLKMHQLVLKKLSEKTMYKCDNDKCSFKTLRKITLQNHMLVHKNPLEVMVYECGNENCSYKAVRKGSLESHVSAKKPFKNNSV